MVIIAITHGIKYDGNGFPQHGISDVRFFDLCDSDDREEMARLAELAPFAHRTETHAVDNDIPMFGMPFGHIAQRQD